MTEEKECPLIMTPINNGLIKLIRKYQEDRIMTEKKYTLDELKEKLIQLTGKYVELESYNNYEAREIKHSIDVIINSIYWYDHNEFNATNIEERNLCSFDIGIIEELEALILNNEDDFDRGGGKYILRQWISSINSQKAKI